MSTSAPSSPRPLDECTALQRDILILTAQHGAQSGKQLLDLVNSTYEESDNTVSESSFYSHLNQLQSLGLMEIRKVDGRTKEYYLSESGARRLVEYAAWVRLCTGRLTPEQ